MLFDLYLFADYSGARARSAQRKAIRLAKANPKDSPTIVEKRFTREELTAHFVECLREATHQGVRVCFGQDHQYGIPFALGRDLGLDGQPWREVLDKLCSGSYGTGAPALAHPATFGAAFNKWLTSRKDKPCVPYFYSATKSKLYGVPSCNPRGGDKSTYRLTELCKPLAGAGNPMSFNRLGDNGAVGGQSLLGMISLHELLKVCSEEEIPVAAWPFDGLSIVDSTYDNAHVLVEPYPTAVRHAHVPQTDESDALAAARQIWEADVAGNLTQLLDLSRVTNEDGARIRFEGWIISHDPAVSRRI